MPAALKNILAGLCAAALCSAAPGSCPGQTLSLSQPVPGAASAAGVGAAALGLGSAAAERSLPVQAAVLRVGAPSSLPGLSLPAPALQPAVQGLNAQLRAAPVAAAALAPASRSPVARNAAAPHAAQAETAGSAAKSLEEGLREADGDLQETGQVLGETFDSGRLPSASVESLDAVLSRTEASLREREGLLSGEFVRIEGNPGMRLQAEYWGQWTVEVPLPTLGRYSGEGDGDSARVEVYTKFGWVEVQVPRDALTPLPVGHAASFRHGLGEMKLPKLSFAPGERVRYRDERSGLMKTGVFLGMESGKYVLQDSGGEKLLIPMRLVYRWTGGEERPFTPRFRIDRSRTLWPEFEVARGTLLELFLDKAALLSSHPEFLSSGTEGRFQLLMRLVRMLVPPDLELGESIEPAGLHTFDDILAAGVGVCRHLSTLLAAALIEAGYRVRLMTLIPRGSHLGHAWLEVEEGGETYVLDPTYGFIGTLARVRELALQGADTLAARWFLREERRATPVEDAAIAEARIPRLASRV